MMEFMPCALAPAYGVTSMPFHPGCHRPFYRSTDVRSLPLLSLGLLAALLDFCLFMLLPPSRPSCFSISSRPTASLSGPSPCLYTAGAYCYLCGRCRIRTCGVRSPSREMLLSTTQPTFLCFVYCPAIASRPSEAGRFRQGFLVFTSPFSLPSFINLLIWCFG